MRGGLRKCVVAVSQQQATDCLTDTPSVTTVPPNEIVFSGVAIGYADECSVVNELRSERGALEDWATFYPGDWDTGHTAPASKL